MIRMGRPRTRHRDMPPGCRLIAGRWYVDATNAHLARVIADLTGGKRSMFLAVDKRQAREKYVHLFVRPLEQFAAAEAGTVAELVALARMDLLPIYRSAKGRAEAERYLAEIGKEFGARRYAIHTQQAATGGTTYLRKFDVQRWLLKQGETRPVAANRCINVMHKMFGLASTLWGKSEYDPTVGVQRNQEYSRQDITPPTPAMFEELYAVAPEWMQCAMLLGRDYARRRVEIMGLSDADIMELGLRFRRGKMRKDRRQPLQIIIEWDDDLRSIVDRMKACRDRIARREGVSQMWLLLNEDGKRVTETGWNSAWARLFERVNKARAKAGLPDLDRETFHFHDLRAVWPSSMDKVAAQHLLAHDDASATEVYRRGPHVIKADFKRAG